MKMKKSEKMKINKNAREREWKNLRKKWVGNVLMDGEWDKSDIIE
jgi:hypothetical protein